MDSIKSNLANSGRAPATPAVATAPPSGGEPATPVGDRVTVGSGDPRELRITHFTPAGGGEFVRSRKFVADIQEKLEPVSGPKGAIFCERAEGGRFLTRATLDGDVLYRVPLQGESTRRLVGSHDGSRAYVLTAEGVQGVDAQTGRGVGRVTFADKTYKQHVLPQADGRVALLDGKNLVWLDQDLKETGRQEMPWDLNDLRPLDGGGMILVGPNDFFHLGQVKVLGADGRALFCSEQVRPEAISVARDGRLLMLEFDGQGSSQVVRLDPKTGEIGRHEAALCARAIFPQENGTYVVYSRDSDEISSRFEQRGADGSLLRAFSFERAGNPRNFLVDPKGERAYVVINSNNETSVYRLELTTKGDEPGKPSQARLMHTAPTNLVVPPVLGDGRLAVFAPNSVTVYGPDGTVQETFASLKDFQEKVGSPAPDLHENMVLGDRPRADGKAPLSAWLSVAAHNLRFSDNRDFVDPKPRPGSATFTSDRCINFAMTEDAGAALGEMRLPDASVYEQMTMRRPDPAVLVDERAREFGFSDGGPGLQVSRQGLTWQTAGGEPHEDKAHDVAAALPVRAGDHYYAALAEHANGTERGITWCEQASGRTHLFDLGGTFSGLYADGNAVYAVGSNGSVLMFEPPAAPGQPLEAPVHVPRSANEPTPQGAKVVQTEETVIIGGLVLKRRVVDRR